MTPPPDMSSNMPLATTIELGPSNSGSNNKRGYQAVHRAYPWLLLFSTMLAGVFCYLFISKPVIETTQITTSPVDLSAPARVKPNALASTPAEKPESIDKPEPSRLDAARPAVVAPQELSADSSHGAYEETNLKIQHVLGAKGPVGEDLGRIILEVPVLYESGSIRWTQDDVEEARSLLARVNSYQERSRALRNEAVQLVQEWDSLIIRSIPDAALRVDSPTLPENQGVGTAAQAQIKSTEAIEIENP